MRISHKPHCLPTSPLHPAPPPPPRLPMAQKAQALLGQMLMEGYGCEADPVKGREWADKARRRGYRMDGVYCRWVIPIHLTNCIVGCYKLARLRAAVHTLCNLHRPTPCLPLLLPCTGSEATATRHSAATAAGIKRVVCLECQVTSGRQLGSPGFRRRAGLHPKPSPASAP